MSATLRVVDTALDAAAASVSAAAEDIRIGARIRHGSGVSELGSDRVASALSDATAQQVQRSELAADSVRAAARFPREAKASYQEQDTALAGAVTR